MTSRLILIPGAPKSGTTTLHAAVVASGGSANTRLVKEPHYFLKDLLTPQIKLRAIKDWEKYKKSCFINDELSIDASQSYFTEPLDLSLVQQMRRQWERIDVVIILRRGVDRVVSAYAMDLANGWVQGSLENLLQAEWEGHHHLYGDGPRYLAESRYLENIERLRKEIPFAFFHFFDFDCLARSDGLRALLKQIDLTLNVAFGVPKKNQRPDQYRPIWLSNLLVVPAVYRLSKIVPQRLKYLIKKTLYSRRTVATNIPIHIENFLAQQYSLAKQRYIPEDTESTSIG